MALSSLTAPTPVDQRGRKGRALAPTLVYCALMMAVVSSLGAPLIPTIATDYRVPLSSAQWSLTVTLLVGAVASPILGRLGDGPRRREVVITSLAVVVTGSVLAGLPIHTFWLLLGGRVLQGFGLALLPLTMSIARDHLDPGRARATVATLSVATVGGVGLGYPITGLVTDCFGLHAGFWLAAILGIVAVALTAAVVPPSTHRPSRRFDFAGGLLLSGGLVSLLLVVADGREWGWGSARLASGVTVTLILLAAWVWHELRTELPLVDLRLVKHRAVLTADVTGLLAGIGMYMVMSMIIRYIQTPTATGYGFGASVVVGGLVLLPLSAASLVASRMATRYDRLIPPNLALSLGVATTSLGIVLFATERGLVWELYVEAGVLGLGMGAIFASLPRMIVGATTPEQTSSAVALNQVLRTVGYSIGSALSATILATYTGQQERFPRDGGYTLAALVALGLCGFTALLSWRLQRHRAQPNTKLSSEAELVIDLGVE